MEPKSRLHGVGSETYERTLNEYVRTKSNRAKIPDGYKQKDMVGIPWRVAFALQSDGWYLRSDIIWAKNNPMPESVTDRPTKSHEYIFLLTKSPRYFYDAYAIAEPATSPGSKHVHKNGNKAEQYVEMGLVTRPAKNYTTGLTRNKRSVWMVNTKPYRDAHFATFPSELIEPCILAGTSEKGQCPKCGRAWIRVIQETEPDLEHQRACGGDVNGEYHGKAIKDYKSGKAQNASDVKARILKGMVKKETVGWRPTCKCNADYLYGKPDENGVRQGREYFDDKDIYCLKELEKEVGVSLAPIPDIVLDIFNGSGTTGQVSLENGRRYIGIELKPEYLELTRKRLENVVPRIRNNFGREKKSVKKIAPAPSNQQKLFTCELMGEF